MLTGVTSFLMLSGFGLVITAQAQDCSRPVPGPNMTLKGNDILLETFREGISVTFVCNIGYQSAGGSGVITCTAGSWSPIRLNCKRKNCGSFGEIQNGNVDYPEGTEFGDQLVITCDSGYDLVGKSKIICGDQGWADRMPVCEVVSCNPPPSIENGNFNPKKEDLYTYGEVVKYSCLKDLTLKGSDTLTCSEGGTFTPEAPTCITVECEEPNIANAFLKSGSRPPHKHKATVTYECNSGYSMKGASTLVCDITGSWTPGLPVCQRVTPPSPTPSAVECEEPNIANAFFKSGSRPPYKHMATVTYECNSGYSMIGASTLVCDMNGKWTPGLPVCQRVTPPTQSPTPSGGDERSSTPLIIGLVVGLIIAILGSCLVCYYCGVLKKKRGSQKGSPDSDATKEGKEQVPLSQAQPPC